MSLTLIGSFPLGAINLSAAASLSITAPLLGQLDLMLFGAFGLGGLQADFALQLNGALEAQLQLGLSISNPLATIQATLTGIASIAASLTAALSLSLPSIQLTASLSASVAISASLALKLGGIQFLIAAAINLKLPAIDFLAQLSANLSAGPVVVASWGYIGPTTTLAQAGADINAAFSAGLGGLVPGDTVFGVLLTTKSLSASVSLAAIIKVT